MSTRHNVLWSNRSIGGAEVYCKNLDKKFFTSTTPLKGISLILLSSLLVDLIMLRQRFILHDFRAGLLVLFSPWRKHILVVHGPGRNRFFTKFTTLLLSPLFKHVVLVSSDLLPTIKLNNMTVVVNFSSANISASVHSNDAIYFGRIEKNKSIDILTNFWRWSKTGTLHIIGDGSILKRLRSENDNNQTIIFHGPLSHNEIRTIASKCKYYISFSRIEGTSLSLIEAMSGGLIPIVSSIPSQSFIHQNLNIPPTDCGFKQLDIYLRDTNKKKSIEILKIQNSCRGEIKSLLNDWEKSWDQMLS